MSHEIKERPILFKGEMVRAILDGRKTMTRRIVKAPDNKIARYDLFEGLVWDAISDSGARLNTIKCPYGKPGDRLWVRETFRLSTYDDCSCYEPCNCKSGLPIYQANVDYGEEKWTPSIFMPRWASRILLEITNVRIERLSATSEKDAKAEGINCYPFYPDDGFPLSNGYTHLPDDGKCTLSPTAVKAFKNLWESINGAGSWDENPWVWVVEFKRIEQ